MQAPEIALAYPWTHFISGHLGRLATRDDVAVHQQYIADIEASRQGGPGQRQPGAVLRALRGERLGWR